MKKINKMDKYVRLPVRFVDGHWESIYGGPLQLRDGAYGELKLSLKDIADTALARALCEKRDVHVFGPGTELRIALTVRTEMPREISRYFVNPSEMRIAPTQRPAAGTRFIPVQVGGQARGAVTQRPHGVWLAFEGFEATRLDSGAIDLPEGLMSEPAISLNHAFTVLSEACEPWRKAHTANIYDRVFYQEQNGFWYPLDDLRQRELASVERKVVQSVWNDVSRQLGLPFDSKQTK